MPSITTTKPKTPAYLTASCRRRVSILRKFQNIVFVVLLFSLISCKNSLTTFPTLTNIDCDTTTTSSTRNQEVLSQSPQALSLQQTDIGSLGQSGTSRHHYIYYDTLYFLSLQYGYNATNALEVGCAKDPFINYLTWIPRKDCVAPYQVVYEDPNGDKSQHHESVPSSSATVQSSSTTTTTTNMITADFAQWDPTINSLPPNLSTIVKYDLVICSQVVEHVNQPREFVQKLLQTTNNYVIISVPYKWKPCKTCNHKTHNINIPLMKTWSEPYEPIDISIITEENKMSRLIMIFQPKNIKFIS